MTVVAKMQKMVMKALKSLDDPRVSGSVKLALVLYAGLVAPKMPSFLAKLLKNPAVKLVVMFLIVFTGIKDPVMSLLIAVGFIVSMMSLERLETVDSISGVMNMAVDVPQELMNKVLDGTQDLVSGVAGVADDIPLVGGLVGAPVNKVVGTVNSIVDSAQDVVNSVVDTVQEKVLGAKEGFSMEDRTRTSALATTVPDMTSLDGLSGYDSSEPAMGPVQ